MNFCIISHVYNESEIILKRYFSTVRSIYPSVDLTMICDGNYIKIQEDLCNNYNCKYILGKRLKKVDTGNEWISRFLNIFKSKEYELMIQLDPDALLHNKFIFPQNLDYYGDLITDQSTKEKYIAGFCVGITKNACNKILDSNLLKIKDFSNNSYIKPYGKIFRYETSLYEIIKELNIQNGHWQGVTSSILTNSNLYKYISCSHRPV